MIPRSFNDVRNIQIDGPQNNTDVDSDRYVIKLYAMDGTMSWTPNKKGRGLITFPTLDGVRGFLMAIFLSHPDIVWVIEDIGYVFLTRIEQYLTDRVTGARKIEIVTGIKEDANGEIDYLLKQLL